MPQRKAITAADWASAELSNVRVRPDGSIEPAAKNLLANSNFLELDAEGDPVWWDELIGPPTPTGWHVYTKVGRQTVYGALPLSQTTYHQSSALASGIPYLKTSSAPSGAPELTSAPTATAVTASTTLGLAAGWYGTALAWITASEADGGLPTPPSVRDAVQLTLGQRITLSDLPLASEAPSGAYGLAILSTSMQASEANALNTATPLYVQQVYSLDSLPTSCVVSGPIRTDNASTLEAGVDPTAVGAYGTYDSPIWHVSPSSAREIPASLSLDLSWEFLTDSGWSAAQDSVTITPPATEGAGIEARPPTKPPRATAWRLLWKASGAAGTLGVWQRHPSVIADFRTYAFALESGSTTLAALPTIDESGMEAPDAPTATALTGGLPTLTGTHKVRVAFSYTGGESAGSPQASVTLSSSETFSVTKPSLTVGSCVVLEDPVDRHSDLIGIPHNQIRYSAPAGTPQDYRICRYAPRVVVKGGTSYRVSAYVKAASISEASLYEIVFRDKDGILLGNADPLVTLAAGTYAWARYSKTYVAPAHAVFMEVYGHRVGAGTITLGPPQVEVGTTTTAYDPSPAEEGYAIMVWDTFAGAHGHVFGRPQGFSSGTAVVTPDPDYTHALSYASSDVPPRSAEYPANPPASTWDFFEDIEDVPFADYIATKIEMEAL